MSSITISRIFSVDFWYSAPALDDTYAKCIPVLGFASILVPVTLFWVLERFENLIDYVLLMNFFENTCPNKHMEI